MASTISLLVIGLGTLHDLECAWFPSSAFLWRRCTLLDRDRTSRPDIVADIRKLNLDLPQCQFDVATTAYGIHGEVLDDDSSRACASACRNVHHMLKPDGLFVCYLSDRSINALARAKGVATRLALEMFAEEVEVAVPLLFERIRPGKAKKCFVEPFVRCFFNSAERLSVSETLEELSKSYVVLRKKSAVGPCHGADHADDPCRQNGGLQQQQGAHDLDPAEPHANTASK